MKLQPDEVELTGRWIMKDGQVVGDEIEKRISFLISHVLKKIKDSPSWGAWETLFQDPDDLRFWERTYLHSEMQGGGPLTLRTLSKSEAETKYKLSE